MSDFYYYAPGEALYNLTWVQSIYKVEDHLIVMMY